VLEPAVRGVAVKLAEFFAALKNPPQEQQILASSLDLAERAQGMSRNVSIMQLEECYNRRGRNLEVVWRDAGKFSDFDSNKTYYYVPLSGYQMISSKGYTSGKDLLQDITSVPGIFSGTLYGVRKSDIETIQLQKNWVNVEEHVSQQMNSINLNKILLGLVRAGLENTDIFIYNNKEIVKLIDSSSPYAKFVNQFVDIDKPIHQTYTIERLFAKFVPNAKLNITNLVDKHQSELGAINKRYPLLTSLSSYRVNAGHIAEYISLIDGKKETV
jgi:hypothetical protein